MNAYPNGEKFYRQSERIARALKAAGAEAEVVLNGSLSLFVGADGRIRGARECDFAVYLDKDKYLGRMLEKTGLRLFNRAEAVERCDDKMLTYLALSESGLCVPETIAAPLCYTPGVQANERFLASVAERLSFPLVVKKSFGSFGKDVRLVYDREALKETAQEFLYCPHFYQRYIAESAGRDIRVLVIGGKGRGGRAQRGLPPCRGKGGKRPRTRLLRRGPSGKRAGTRPLRGEFQRLFRGAGSRRGHRRRKTLRGIYRGHHAPHGKSLKDRTGRTDEKNALKRAFQKAASENFVL